MHLLIARRKRLAYYHIFLNIVLADFAYRTQKGQVLRGLRFDPWSDKAYGSTASPNVRLFSLKLELTSVIGYNLLINSEAATAILFKILKAHHTVAVLALAFNFSCVYTNMNE